MSTKICISSHPLNWSSVCVWERERAWAPSQCSWLCVVWFCILLCSFYWGQKKMCCLWSFCPSYTGRLEWLRNLTIIIFLRSVVFFRQCDEVQLISSSINVTFIYVFIFPAFRALFWLLVGMIASSRFDRGIIFIFSFSLTLNIVPSHPVCIL